MLLGRTLPIPAPAADATDKRVDRVLLKRDAAITLTGHRGIPPGHGPGSAGLGTGGWGSLLAAWNSNLSLEKNGHAGLCAIGVLLASGWFFHRSSSNLGSQAP